MNQSSPAVFVSQAYAFVCKNHLWLPDGKKFVVKELPTKCDQLQAIYKQMRPTAKLISIKKAIARLGFRRKESKEGEITYFHDPEFYVWKCPWTFSRSQPPDLDFVCPKPRQDEYLKKRKSSKGSQNFAKKLSAASNLASLSPNSESAVAGLLSDTANASVYSSHTSSACSPSNNIFNNSTTNNNNISNGDSPLFVETSYPLDSHFIPSPTNCTFTAPIILGEGKSGDEELLFLNQDAFMNPSIQLPAISSPPYPHQPIRFDNSSPGSLAVAAATAVAMSQPKLPASFLSQSFQFQVPLAPQHQALTNFHTVTGGSSATGSALLPSTHSSMYSSASKATPITSPTSGVAAAPLPSAMSFYPVNFFGNASCLPETDSNNGNNGISSPEQSNISLVGGETCSLNQPPLPSFSPFDNFYGNSISQYFFGPPQCDDELSRFLSDLENSISN